MKRSEVITMAGLLTEQKGKPLTDKMALVFSFVVQDICKRNRFWWRKQSLTFPTVAGTTTYDVTAVTTVPASQLSETAVEEVTLLQVLDTSVSPSRWVKLTPIYDDAAIQDMLLNTTQSAPGRYTFAPNDYKTILTDPPDKVYTLRMNCWAMPNPATDSSSETVPLIPPWGHNTIVEGMAAYIWESMYGLRDPKTVDYKKRYEDSIINLQARPRFSTDYVQTLTSSEDAIRST
ncbi:MAG: hypothetical protein EPN91_03170 [Salinibacterium sp.]|nr:MAG: hypothetical protein EPN91_03170 [Salinibacterium sp.]